MTTTAARPGRLAALEHRPFAAVLVDRVLTFYLPPLWGFFALDWLKRHDYL